MFDFLRSVWRRTSSNKAVSDRVRIVEDALFGQMSSRDIDGIRAVAELVSSLCENETEAAVDGGVFIFFKVKSPSGSFQVVTKRLTVDERALINEQPTILGNPYELLERLEEAKAIKPERAMQLRRIAGRQDPSNRPPDTKDCKGS